MALKFIRKYKNTPFVISSVFKLKNLKPEDAIIISSEPRSGSTWLAEIIQTLPNRVINWEPANYKSGVIPHSYNLGGRPHIPENCKDQRYIRLFNQILTSKIHSQWTSKKLNFYSARHAQQVITKFVRINNSLFWLVNQYQFKHKPIVLVRHPISCVLSQHKTFDVHFNKAQQENFVFPKVEHPELYEKYEPILNQITSYFQMGIVNWCINYVELIRRMNENKFTYIFYEDLLLNPIAQIEKINKESNLDIDIEKVNFKKASSSNFLGNFEKSNEVQLSKWLESISEQEKQKTQEILDYFQIQVYSAFEALPQKQGLDGD